MHWFDEARFGMFIHWGLYSLAARHEWVKSREELTDQEYDRYLKHFDPDLYDPARWAAEARRAGMRYMVLTTKHHDGFCLWPSKLTDYTVMSTPYGKDLVGPFVDAARAEGMRIGFYHSLLDWHHPEFPIDGRHPQRDDEDAKRAAANRDIARYADYLHGQVRELLTSYGQVDYLFFDYSYRDRVWGGKGAPEWRSEELLALVRELQPGIIVNNRLGIPGDLMTPEQVQPSRQLQQDGSPVRWEACQTFNGSWGYDRDNTDWKSTDLLVRMLIDGVAKGGNLLLNVGPDARGRFEPRAVERLRGIGEWMRLHSRAIHGAGPAPYEPPPDCRYTLRGDRLYLHLFAWPFKQVHLPGLGDRVAYAQFLHDASEVRATSVRSDVQAQNATMFGEPASTLTLKLPVQRPDVLVPVIEMFLT